MIQAMNAFAFDLDPELRGRTSIPDTRPRRMSLARAAPPQRGSR